MSRLFIAEKPSLARAAATLASPQKKDLGLIRCANRDAETGYIGHLHEQVEPDAKDAKYKRWNKG